MTNKHFFNIKYKEEDFGNMLLRTLTLKSKIGFGNFKDCTVQELFIMGKENELISMYFCLSKINFNKEIIEMLNIPESLILQKPSKAPENKKLYWQYIDTIRLNSMTKEEYTQKAMEFGAKKHGKQRGITRRVERNISNISSKGALKRRNQKK